MQKTAIALLFIAPLIRAAAASDADALALDTLARHGVRPAPEALIDFLENGFAAGTLVSALPAAPPEKTQLLIFAMQALGKAGKREAFGAIARFAESRPSPGALEIVRRDSMLAPAAERGKRQQELLEYLKYNAAVALGFLGDPRGAPILRQLFETETNAIERCQYALCLACVGDASGVEFLVLEVAKANRDSSVAAAKSLYYITGQDLGFASTSPIRLRERLAEDCQRWWAEIRSDFRLEPAAIIRRRLDPIPPPRIPLSGVSNLLLAASDYADLSNARGSRTAANQLDQMGPSLAEELEPILKDPMADLRVRREAIRRYAALKEKSGKRALKKLFDDENPEIAEYARHAVEAIDKGVDLTPYAEIVENSAPAK